MILYPLARSDCGATTPSGFVAVAVDLNFADAHLGETLAVPLQLLVLLLALEVEDENLVVATLADDGAEDLGGLAA